MTHQDKFTPEAIAKRNAAKARVAVWLNRFEDERTSQLNAWMAIEARKKQEREDAEAACFWARVGKDYNRDSETWEC